MTQIGAQFQFVKRTVSTVCALAQISVLVKLDGMDNAAIFASQCQAASMVCVEKSSSTEWRSRLPKHASVKDSLQLMFSLIQLTSIQVQDVINPFAYLHAKTVECV